MDIRAEYSRWLERAVDDSDLIEELRGLDPDGGEVSDWARDAFAWAIEHIIITGADDGTLAPRSTATRAQCAAILMRYAENV